MADGEGACNPLAYHDRTVWPHGNSLVVDEEQRRAANRTGGRIGFWVRCEVGRHARERDAAEDEQQDELRQSDREQRDQGEPKGREHDEDDRDRKDELQHPAVGDDPG